MNTTHLKAAVRSRRAASAARRRLHRELATYSTPSQINDLLMIVGHGDDAESTEIRSILVGNLQRCA